MIAFEFLRRAHDTSVELAQPLGLDGLNAQRRAALLLYGTIVELTGALTALGEQRNWVGAASVGRSCLEAYVDFQNVIENENYVSDLEAHWHEAHLKQLRAAKDEENPFFAGVRSMGTLDELIATSEQRLRELKQVGFGALTIRERFRRAKAEKIYVSVYSVLSEEAHNGLAKLYTRQLKGKQLRFGLYRSESPAEYLHLIDTTAAMLTHATSSIHELLNSPSLERARELQHALAEVRKGYKL